MIRAIFILFLACSIAQANPVQDAAKLSQSANYEASERMLVKVPVKDQEPTYYFYKMINAYGLNDKKGATKWGEMIEHSFGEVPQRYRDMAALILADVSMWKDETDDLHDIAREMKKAGDRLHNGMGGPMTRSIQKDVEDRLAKMIKTLEGPLPKKGDKNGDSQVESPSSSPSTMPATDSHGNQHQGEGQIDKRRMREIAKNWGNLPEKERAEAVQELTRNLPPRDRAIIEAYLRTLKK